MRNVVFSDHVNAWSIKKGLKKLGLKTYAVNSRNKLFNSIKLDELKDDDTLFFTDENSLGIYVNSNRNYFEPSVMNTELLDDKLKFADYLLTIDELPIPSKSLNFEEKEFPFYLKCRHSWMQGEKLPRGYIVYNSDDVQRVRKYILEKNWKEDWFFHQKLLKSNIENNISASGYFDYIDNSRNIIILSKKTMGSTSTMATGAVVETIKDPSNLIDRTINILNKMKYKGPFELEFFYEVSEDIYYLLELNPRFWMQHGIFVKFYNNGVIKRYLNLEKKHELYDNGQPAYKHIVWIDSIYLLECTFKFKFKDIKDILTKSGRKVLFPSIPAAFYYLSIRYINSIKKRLRS